MSRNRMEFLTRLLIIVLGISGSLTEDIGNNLEDNDELVLGYSDRETRQLYPIPGLVRFANNVCVSQEGYMGTCITRRQCQFINGAQSGSCISNGIGRCCLIQRTCGQRSAYNNTYFSSAGFPNSFNGDTSCTFIIDPCPGNSCQARLDFLNFNLAQPDGNGNCVADSMVITGSGGTVPIICGENSGQHLYLTFIGNSSITITITTSSTVDLQRSYNFLVTQIACDCPTLAPAGCLQYYTELTNTVRSFNYGTTINGAIVNLGNTTTVAGTRQLANTNYGICIYMQPGYCSIQWAQSADPTSFTVTDNTALAEVVTGLPSGPLTSTVCTSDYVVIPNPIYVATGLPAGTDRFCGNQLLTVTTTSKPFVLTTVTDANEITTGDVANRGFSLTYTQMACANVNPAVMVIG